MRSAISGNLGYSNGTVLKHTLGLGDLLGRKFWSTSALATAGAAVLGSIRLISAWSNTHSSFYLVEITMSFYQSTYGNYLE